MSRKVASRKTKGATPAPDDASFRLETWPFYWLTRVVALYLEELQVALKPAGLDVPRWRVLMSLRGQECASVSEIAEHAIVKLPTMTKIIQRMQADGLVECRVRDTDARVTEVVLTTRGHEARHQAWEIAAGVYAQAFKDVGAGEVQGLNKLLTRIFGNLN
jgi:DNA-binding MarR family transcriptional regulator